MTVSKWLILIGSILLFAGLGMVFISSHYTARVMEKARLGIAVLSPERDSPEWKEKERKLWLADFWFWAGLVVTAIGIVLQTLGAILPLRP